MPLSLTDLPVDVLGVVLSFLPTHDVLAARAACRLLAEAAEVGWRGRSLDLLRRAAAPTTSLSALSAAASRDSSRGLHDFLAVYGPMEGLYRVVLADGEGGMLGALTIVGGVGDGDGPPASSSSSSSSPHSPPRIRLTLWRTAGQPPAATFTLHVSQMGSQATMIAVRDRMGEEGAAAVAAPRVFAVRADRGEETRALLRGGGRGRWKGTPCPQTLLFTALCVDDDDDDGDGGEDGADPYASWVRTLLPGDTDPTPSSSAPAAVASPAPAAYHRRMLLPGSAFVLERLPPTAVPARALELASTVPECAHWTDLFPLVGLWRALYGPHGVETLHLSLELDEEEEEEVVGDASPVPAAAAAAAASSSPPAPGGPPFAGPPSSVPGWRMSAVLRRLRRSADRLCSRLETRVRRPAGAWSRSDAWAGDDDEDEDDEEEEEVDEERRGDDGKEGVEDMDAAAAAADDDGGDTDQSDDSALMRRVRSSPLVTRAARAGTGAASGDSEGMPGAGVAPLALPAPSSGPSLPPSVAVHDLFSWFDDAALDSDPEGDADADPGDITSPRLVGSSAVQAFAPALAAAKTRTARAFLAPHLPGWLASVADGPWERAWAGVRSKLPPPRSGPGRSTEDVASALHRSDFWPRRRQRQRSLSVLGVGHELAEPAAAAAAAAASAPPAAGRRFPTLRLVARKIVGDPNVPSGQRSLEVKSAARALPVPEEATTAALERLEGTPIFSFGPLEHEVILRVVQRHAITSAHLGVGQINMSSRAWTPRFQPGLLISWPGGSTRGVVEGSRDVPPARTPGAQPTFSFVWLDDDRNWLQMTDYDRVQLEGVPERVLLGRGWTAGGGAGRS
jgi:hypothetical protein